MTSKATVTIELNLPRLRLPLFQENISLFLIEDGIDVETLSWPDDKTIKFETHVLAHQWKSRLSSLISKQFAGVELKIDILN